MANSYSPFGLMPVKNLDGGDGVLRVNRYYIPASLNAVAVGTPVTLAQNASTVNIINGAFVGYGIQQIAVASGGDTNKVLGSIVGFDVVPGNLQSASGFNAANQVRLAYVADHPEQLFDIVDDGVNALTASTSAGLNANLTIGTASQIGGDTSSLNTTTPASTATFQLKILGLAPEPNNTFAASAKWRVKINNHSLGNVVAGV